MSESRKGRGKAVRFYPLIDWRPCLWP